MIRMQLGRDRQDFLSTGPNRERTRFGVGDGGAGSGRLCEDVGHLGDGACLPKPLTMMVMTGINWSHTESLESRKCDQSSG